MRFISYEVRCAVCDEAICFSSWTATLPCLYCKDCAEKLEQQESALDESDTEEQG